MSRRRFSYQYATPCIALEEGEQISADDLMEECREAGAIYYEEGPDDECFVVDIGRGVGAELWTERALKGSLA